jgi:hypothetical protein
MPMNLKNLIEDEDMEPLITHFKCFPDAISFSDFSELLTYYINKWRGHTNAK